MLRSLAISVSVLALCLGTLSADDKKDTKGDEKHKATPATISKVDAKKHALTVKMKGQDGKDAEKEFKLTEEVRYMDSTGKVVAVDVFKSGDYVLIIEEDGKLKEMKHDKKKDDKSKDDKSKDDKSKDDKKKDGGK